jgi:hypothetical protein
MDNDWTKVLGFPGYRVYKHEIDEQRKHLDFLWKFPKDRLENGIKIKKTVDEGPQISGRLLLAAGRAARGREAEV